MSTAITEYAVKRCKQFGFIKSYEFIDSICSECTDYIMYITDVRGDEKDKLTQYLNTLSKKVIVTNSIDDISKLNPDEHVSIYIELAHERDSEEHINVEIEDISTAIQENIEKYCKTLTDKQTVIYIKNTFNRYVVDNAIFDDCELDEPIIDAIVYLYKHVQDTQFQCEMYNILKGNQYADLKKLVEEHPIAEEVKPIKIYPLTEMFEDIDIATMKTESGDTINKNFTRKITDYQDPEKIQQLLTLRGFSLNKYVVHHGKKYNSSLQNSSEYQNHDVLQTIYTNGVHTVPRETVDNYNISIKRLMKYLHTLKSFDIIFIHPNLAINGEISESPNPNVQPSYTVGKAEILSIVYRYIAIYFFGYCSVYNEDIEELGYLI